MGDWTFKFGKMHIFMGNLERKRLSIVGRKEFTLLAKYNLYNLRLPEKDEKEINWNIHLAVDAIMVIVTMMADTKWFYVLWLHHLGAHNALTRKRFLLVNHSWNLRDLILSCYNPSYLFICIETLSNCFVPFSHVTSWLVFYWVMTWFIIFWLWGVTLTVFDWIDILSWIHHVKAFDILLLKFWLCFYWQLQSQRSNSHHLNFEWVITTSLSRWFCFVF